MTRTTETFPFRDKIFFILSSCKFLHGGRCSWLHSISIALPCQPTIEKDRSERLVRSSIFLAPEPISVR